jgi:hypothetical protein
MCSYTFPEEIDRACTTSKENPQLGFMFPLLHTTEPILISNASKMHTIKLTRYPDGRTIS